MKGTSLARYSLSARHQATGVSRLKSRQNLITIRPAVVQITCCLLAVVSVTCTNPKREVDSGHVLPVVVAVRTPSILATTNQSDSSMYDSGVAKVGPTEASTDAGFDRSGSRWDPRNDNEFLPAIDKAVRAYLRTLPVYDAARLDDQGVFRTRTHPPDCGGVTFCIKNPAPIRSGQKVGNIRSCLKNVAYRDTKLTPHTGFDFGAPEESTWIAELTTFVTNFERQYYSRCCCYILNERCK